MREERGIPSGKRHKASRLMALSMLICGLFLILLMPPFTAPDERIHFANIWAISNGSIIPEVADGYPVRRLPESFAPVWTRYPGIFMGVDNQQKYTSAQMLADLSSGEADPSGDGDFPVQTGILSLGYCIPAAGMAIGRLLGALLRLPWLSGIYAQMQAGRLANLIFYASVACLALRRSQFYPATTMLILCMPMSLYLGASLNYDAVIIPTSACWFAQILSLRGAEKKKLQPGDWVRLILSGVLIVGTKPVFAILLPLLFLIQEPLFGNRKHKRLMVLLLMVGICLLGMLPTIIQTFRGQRLSTSPEQEQMNWLSTHILQFPAIFIRTMVQKLPAYAVGFWGNLGWLDVRIPYLIVFSGLLVILLVSCYETGTFPGAAVPHRHRAMILAGLIGALIVFAAGMYVTHASQFEIGGDIVKGIQGRYFIPCFLPLLFAFQNNRLGRFMETRKRQVNLAALNRGIWIAAAAWCIACELITVLTLLFRYWL